MTCPKCGRSCGDDFLYCPACGKKLKTAPKKKAPRRANGTGSVTKLPGKRAKPWRARMASRTVVYNVGTFPTRAEAERALALFRPPDSSVVKAGMTFGEIYDAVTATKEGKVTDATLATYKTAWNHLRQLAHVPFSELNAADFQRIIDNMKGYSRSACDKVRMVVSLVYDWAIANNLTVVNAARFLELAPQKKKKQKEVFTRDDINALWADGSRDAQITLVMIYTGMRINELFSLSPSDVHLNDEGYNYFVGGEKTEAGRDRTIPLNDRIVPLVAGWMEGNTGNYLLRNRTGSKLNVCHWRDRNYYPLLDRLGIERLTPHKARHTFATLAVAAGAEPVSLQKMLGHARFSTTAKYYTHPDMEALQKTADLIE